MKLVFVHGSGNSGEVWKYQTDYFSDSVAVNLPGHPGGKPCTSVDDYADWLHKYLLNHGYKELVLAGHSLGGAIVQTYALKYPQDLKALILIATGARLRVHPNFIAIIADGITDPERWLKEFIEPLYARVPPEFKDRMIKDVAKVGAAVQLNDFLCCDRFDIMDKVSEIKLLTLVICGSEDNLTPVKYSQYLASKIASARLTVIDGATHFVLLEKPAEVNRAISEFLAGLESLGKFNKSAQ